jgi:two-component system, sensor histidine kinase
VVDSDLVLVERILRNLVSNAVRCTERGRIVVGYRRRGPRLAMQAWDTGVGIPEHQQALVFQEYYQLGNPERDRTKGGEAATATATATAVGNGVSGSGM